MCAAENSSSYADSFLDIPGTTIFDAAQARRGYSLNMFCQTLSKATNRETFKADEGLYLDRFSLTSEQRRAVLARDYGSLVKLGGNVFYLAKLVATDGLPVVAMVAQMTGVTQSEHMKMMMAGGRPIVGNRSRKEAYRNG